MNTGELDRKFLIALSFLSEDRRFVQKVATHLAAVLGRDRIFYDHWYELELSGAGGKEIPIVRNDHPIFP
jgi:hypothetical protein